MTDQHASEKESMLDLLSINPPPGELGRARASMAALRVSTELDPDAVTDEHRAILSQWSGWGPLAKALDPRSDGAFGELHQEVKYLLTDDELTAAKAASFSAFYTSAPIIRAAWSVLDQLGSATGRVLEPGCGSGRFMAGAPDGVEMHGVELDPTSAKIGRLLHPAADFKVGRLEQTVLRPRFYQGAVGNVPFADVRVSDRARPDVRFALHNYFILRALEAVEPGGHLALVTSRYTLDSEDCAHRIAFSHHARLLGAVRLPAGAFDAFGTKVVTDVLFFEVAPSDDETVPGWIGTEEQIVDGKWVRVNRYFQQHPEMVLGELTTENTQYGRGDLTVRATGDWEAELDRAVGAIVADGTKRVVTNIATGVDLVDTAGRKEGSFHFVDEEIMQVQEGRLVPQRNSKELRALITLRNCVLDVLEAESDYDRPDESIDLLRTIMGAVYDRYVSKFGAVNRCTIIETGMDEDTGLPMRSRRRPSMGGFRTDPDYVTVLAIEDYDDDTGVGKKGPIFTQRVNSRPEHVTSVDTVDEAIAISMDRLGYISVPVLASLLSMEPKETEQRLAAVAFTDPVTDRWVPADEYLSGNVRQKLRDAKAAAVRDDRWERNVTELKRVQPAEIPPEDITVRLGAPWVEVAVIEQFVRDLLAESEREKNPQWAWVKVDHQPVIATWEVTADRYRRSRPLANATWGTGRMDAFTIIEHGLNGATPLIQDEVEGDGGRKVKVKNAEETLLACDKLASVQEKFGEWLWADAERARLHAARYNELFNSTVLRDYDGSYLTFPGMSAGRKPYPSQLNMVARNLAMPATLCGHPVGAGKTLIMALTAIKLRQLGMARKPGIIVPNHLLEQIARDVKAAFPNARILMAGSTEVTKEKRKLFAAKVATGDWDCIVMTHSAFTAIPVGAHVEAAFLGEQISRYEMALLAEEQTSGGYTTRTMKRIAKSAEKLRSRLDERLSHRADDGVTFEQLGLDYLMVDEAHYYKRLPFPTRAQSFGQGSKRATDLAMKLWYLRDRSDNQRVGSLLSGTLVSNSLAELFVLQSYAQPDRLEALQIDMFDAWAGTFVEYVSAVEVAPDGGSFRVHTRPAKFSNVPELRLIFGEVADICTKADIGLPGPKVNAWNEVIDPTPMLTEFVSTLVTRSERIRAGVVDKHEDNMLVVCSDGRKGALDLDLVGWGDGEPGKIERVVEQVAEKYHATKTNRYLDPTGDDSPIPGALQVVFCDLGTPNATSPQVYGKVRKGLVAAGIPNERIRYIHEAKTDNSKSALFAECRSGKVSVLLGSTDKLGVGTNVQHRLVAIHHLDAPWRPADVEQRNGRGDRPGNQNPVLDVIRYVREGSFDSYMWQGLERKARFISQLFSGRLDSREVADIGDSTLTYTEVKALATGNPLLMEQAEVDSEVVRLRRLEVAHDRAQRRITHQTAAMHTDAEVSAARAKLWALLAQTAAPEGGFVTRDGTTAEEGDVAEGTLLGDAIEAALARRDGEVHEMIGHYRGVELAVHARWGERSDFFWLTARVGGDELKLLNDCERRKLAPSNRWRLAKELARAFEDAMDEALTRGSRAKKLRIDAENNLAEITTFPQAAELAAAEARKLDIETRLAERADADERAKAAAPTPEPVA